MADGVPEPDLSDLLAAFEDPPVVTLHQIGSSHGANSQLMGSNAPFGQASLAVSNERQLSNRRHLVSQNELGQIPELGSDLQSDAFMHAGITQAPIVADAAFSGGNNGSGSLGSLFLSSIESQLDSGKTETAPFVQPIPQLDISKTTQQNQSRQQRPKAAIIPQIRSGSLAQTQHRSTSYSPFSNNSGTGQATISLHNTALSPGDLGVKSNNAGSLPFIMPSDVQPSMPSVQLGGPQKKNQSQFIHPNQSARQPSQPVNPPRPLSAASNTSEHLSRPGSVQQPSPSCASNHSGDPATPLTPQSYNAGTPQPYKPATPQSNLAAQQQKRALGYTDVQNSPQIPQNASSENYMSSQRPIMEFQPSPSPIQSMNASNESLNDIPTPIKDVFAASSSSTTFNAGIDSIDNNNLWNSSPAVMAPSALFVSAPQPIVGSSNPNFVSSDQNLGFGFSSDVYGNLFANSRIPQRTESNVRGESLTAKQNELLDLLSAGGSKKPASQSVPLNSMVVPELIHKSGLSGGSAMGDQSNNASTMDLMNRANNTGTATVEKLLGAHNQYEAISPVSDYAMSPAGKPSLPDELTGNIFSPTKFSSHSELSIHHQDSTSTNQDLIDDPVFIYTNTTKKSETGNTQTEMAKFPTQNAVPELIHRSQESWPVQSSVSKTESLGSAHQQFLTSSSGSSNFSFVSAETRQPSSNVDSWSSMNIPLQTYNVPTTSHHTAHVSQGLPAGFSHAPVNASAALSQDTLKILPTLSPQKHLSPPAITPTTNAKDSKPFGVARSKVGMEKTKGTAFSKKVESSESSFGFESDDDTETICLSKASPKQTNRRICKQTQPNLISPKPRFPNTTASASEDLQMRMEEIRKLQQQQEKLRQMEALQTQHGAISHASNQSKQFHRRLAQSAAAKPQTQHEPAQRKISAEKPMAHIVGVAKRKVSIESLVSSTSRTLEKTPAYPSSQAVTSSTDSMQLLKPSVKVSAPYHLAGHEDTTKYITSSYHHYAQQQNILPHFVQSESQFLPLSSGNIPALSNFSDVSQQARASDMSVTKTNIFSSHPVMTVNTNRHVSEPSTTMNQTVKSTLPLHMSTLLAAPSTNVSSSISLPSLPSYHDPPAVSNSINSTRSSSNSTGQSFPTPTSRTQLNDSSNLNFNLDWLNRESERILLAKSQELELRNTTTPPNVTTSTPAVAARSGSQHLFSANSTSGISARPLVSEDDIPLKQSIHGVDILNNTPKSLPAVTSTAITSAAVTVKKSVPHETRHLNVKKHRILEGALSSSPVKSTATTSTTFSPSSNNLSVARSVLDKQRRYSKEHSNTKPKHRIPYSLDDILRPAPSTDAMQSLKPSDKVSESLKKPTFGTSQADQRSGQNTEEKKKSQQDGKAGNMFMLFNTLLQEASESAKKSTLSSKQESEGPTTKAVSTSQITVSKPSAIIQSEPTKTTVNVTPIPTESLKQKVSSTQSQLPSEPITVMSTSASTVPTTSIQTVKEIKKPAKKNRPAATMPFKRRFLDDAQARISTALSVSATTLVTSYTTTTTVISTTAVTSVASVATVATTLAKPTNVPTQNVTSIPAVAIKIAPLNVMPSNTTTTTVQSSPVKTSPAPQSPSGGSLKLRITAFRSVRGDIIHQSSVLEKDEDSGDLDCSSHKKHKRKKKKKEKKRKISSSDCDSSVSIRSSKSTQDQTARLVEEAKMNEKITKELERKAQSMLKSSEEIAKISIVKEKVVSASKDVTQKRKRTKTDTVDNEAKKPPKRARVTKPNAKKKQDGKVEEPVARYLPKSVLQATSVASGTFSMAPKVTVSLPATYQRAPGKLPLYLSSSDGKSSTAPTIQLVARNTSRIVSSVSDTKTAPSTKIMSVKIPSSLTSKSFTTQILPNSNVQYIIPTSKPQPRIILPSTSTTPVTVPVSVVSPLIVRSFPGGFVPLSVCTLTTTASTKPQLFSVPVSLHDGVTNTLKKNSGKPTAKAKSQQNDVVLTHGSVATKQPTVVRSSLTKTNCTVAVTGVLATPWVTTKVISPATTSQQANANNFQSVFLKLISSPNPVPKYVPPAPPEDLQIDLAEEQNFSCLACEDSFLFDESLEDHYNRRSIMIKVRCMQCDQDMVFLNKCKLLLHARQHSDGMQFNNAHISPIPTWMCKPRSKESFINKTANSTSARRRSSGVSSEDEHGTNQSAGNQTSFPTAVACTDCNFIGATAESLEEHFQRVSPPASPDKNTSGNKGSSHFTCDMCSVTVPNQCSFMAHMRMHKRAVPHTCPECGQTFDNDGLQEHAYSESRREIDFNLHLSIQCFHLSRISAYKCRICSLICETAELLRRHLEVRHLQTFYKCRDCPMAFKTQENIASHQRSAHGVVAVTKMIHKCPLCDTVFTDNSPTQQLFLLQKHFEGHMSHPSVNITAYKCQFCKQIYEKKSLLRGHLKVAHDVTASGDSNCDLNVSQVLLDVSTENMPPASSSGSSRKRPAESCCTKEPVVKLTRISAEDGVTSNALIASGILGKRDWSNKKSSNVKSSTDSPVVLKSTKQPLKLRLKGMNGGPSCGSRTDAPMLNSEGMMAGNTASIMRDGRKVFPCGQCAKELPSASARINHIKLKHQGIRTLYCCPYCPPGKIKFAKKISMTKHLHKVHGMDDIKKQDMRIEYVKLPIGQRFDPTIVATESGDAEVPRAPPEGKRNSVENKVRKKFTRPGRKLDRPVRQARWEAENSNSYIENSDSEVEHIMRNRFSDVVTSDKSDKSDGEEPDFSVLKLPEIYTCATCEYKSNDRLEFQAHILEHKEDTEAEGLLNVVQQCTECGLCFASNSSHTNHLFIKHKIKKKRLLEKYDKQLKAKRRAKGNLPSRLSGEGPVDGVDGGSDLNKKKQKCSVCFKRFDNENQLRTHMRTHGLAFVKSKHAS